MCTKPTHSTTRFFPSDSQASLTGRCLSWVICVDFAIPAICPLSGSSRTCQFDVANLRIGVILAPEPEHVSDLKSGAMLLADRGYDADWIRAFAGEHGAWANIPPKRNRKDPICFSPYLYRARNLVERFFNRIKQCRRVATRYDKLAANYLAFIKLASIRIWLRAYKSTPWSTRLNQQEAVKRSNLLKSNSFQACRYDAAGLFPVLLADALSGNGWVRTC
jgi:transposase